VRNSLHGPISTFEHPQFGKPLARAAGPDDVVGNRIYLAWGVGDDGALQIVDRKKLLPITHGGSWNGLNPDTPSNAEIEAAQTGLHYMSGDQGGHTSMPVFGLTPASYAKFTEFKTRDIVLLASEATANLCQEAPHWSFVVDVTIEIRRPHRRERGSSKVRGKGRWSSRPCGSIRAWARSILGATIARAERATACIRARRTSAIRFTAS